MNRKRWIALLLAMVMALCLVGCGGKTPDAAPGPEPDQSTDGAVTVTDMIGREVTVIPGSYQRVVCIGAGALRIYSYVGDAALLCGVEDIDNTTLSERPKMFDNVARPYVMAYGDVFAQPQRPGGGGGEDPRLPAGHHHLRVQGRGEGRRPAGAGGRTGHHHQHRPRRRI